MISTRYPCGCPPMIVHIGSITDFSNLMLHWKLLHRNLANFLSQGWSALQSDNLKKKLIRPHQKYFLKKIGMPYSDLDTQHLDIPITKNGRQSTFLSSLIFFSIFLHFLFFFYFFSFLFSSTHMPNTPLIFCMLK